MASYRPIEKQRFRVIVRPWVPKKIPHTIPSEHVTALIEQIRPILKPLVYAGWCKRKENGKRILRYLLATGYTMSEALTAFKVSARYGVDVWKVE